MSERSPDASRRAARGGQDAQEAAETDKRLASLDRRLRAARGDRAVSGPHAAERNGHGRALGFAFRIAAELAAGVGLGVLVGWQLDQLFGTRPFLLIALTLLGAAGGLWTVIRTADRMQRLDRESSEGRGERSNGNTRG